MLGDLLRAPSKVGIHPALGTDWAVYDSFTGAASKGGESDKREATRRPAGVRPPAGPPSGLPLPGTVRGHWLERMRYADCQIRVSGLKAAQARQ
jgi:hypothetical protein